MASDADGRLPMTYHVDGKTFELGPVAAGSFDAYVEQRYGDGVSVFHLRPTIVRAALEDYAEMVDAVNEVWTEHD